MFTLDIFIQGLKKAYDNVTVKNNDLILNEIMGDRIPIVELEVFETDLKNAYSFNDFMLATSNSLEVAVESSNFGKSYVSYLNYSKKALYLCRIII